MGVRIDWVAVAALAVGMNTVLYAVVSYGMPSTFVVFGLGPVAGWSVMSRLVAGFERTYRSVDDQQQEHLIEIEG